MAPQARDAGTAALCAQSVRDDGDRDASTMEYVDEEVLTFNGTAGSLTFGNAPSPSQSLSSPTT